MGNMTENKLGTGAEGKILLENGVPMMLSLFVAAFYNLADTFFVSQISGTGEAAAWLTARRYGKIRKGETPCGT